MTKLSLKVPATLGANKQTMVLAGFVGAIVVGVSFAVNRFDNPLTRAVNTIRSGELPTTVIGV